MIRSTSSGGKPQGCGGIHWRGGNQGGAGGGATQPDQSPARRGSRSPKSPCGTGGTAGLRLLRMRGSGSASACGHGLGSTVWAPRGPAQTLALSPGEGGSRGGGPSPGSAGAPLGQNGSADGRGGGGDSNGQAAGRGRGDGCRGGDKAKRTSNLWVPKGEPQLLNPAGGARCLSAGWSRGGSGRGGPGALTPWGATRDCSRGCKTPPVCGERHRIRGPLRGPRQVPVDAPRPPTRTGSR